MSCPHQIDIFVIDQCVRNDNQPQPPTQQPANPHFHGNHLHHLGGLLSSIRCNDIGIFHAAALREPFAALVAFQRH